MMKYIALLGVVLMLAGCASYWPMGIIYTEAKMGAQAGSGTADKTGRACVQSILGDHQRVGVGTRLGSAPKVRFFPSFFLARHRN